MKRLLLLCCFALFLAICVSSSSLQDFSAAYAVTLYGYPLVTMAVKMQAQVIEMGFNNVTNYGDLADYRERLIPSPNADTLYSVAWFDLRAEPMLLRTPDVSLDSRFYIWEFLDFETNVIDSISPRTNTQSAPLNVILVHNTSSALASIPTDLLKQSTTRLIVSNSPIVWLIGRTLVRGDPDLPAARLFQNQLKCLTLSTFLHRPAPPQPQPIPAFNQTDVPTDAVEFFRSVFWALSINGVPPNHVDYIPRFQVVGIDVVNNVFDASQVNLLDSTEFHAALTKIDTSLAGVKLQVNLWGTSYDIGNFGDDYELRAVVAKKYLGGNLALDSLYFVQYVDQHYIPLNGENQYQIQFDQPLPSRGFWSLCAYNSDHFFEQNDYNRYTIGTATPGLVLNAQGGTTLYLSFAPPTNTTLMTNWLPVPKASFSLMLRAYWPKQDLLNTSYQIPSVYRTN